MTIIHEDKELNGADIRIEYRYLDNKWVRPEIKIRLENKGDRRLHVALLDLTETYKISTALMEQGSIRLEPGETAWAYRGRPIPVTVPDEIWKQGVVEYKDILKLIVCTDEFDSRLMAQPAPDLPRPATRAMPGLPKGSLDRLMQRVQTRDMGDDETASPADWNATAVTFTTVRPQESIAVPTPGATAALTGGVAIKGHSELSARARLTTAPVASRSLGDLALPRLLSEDQALTEPFSLAPTRGDIPRTQRPGFD